MAGRPPLPIGTHGKIESKDVTPDGQTRPRVWLAWTYYRDADGKTRRVKRTGGSKSAAENGLRKALSERQHDAATALTGSSKLRDAADRWFEQREAEVDAGTLSTNTLGVYRSSYRNHIVGPLGDVRLRELTVSRCEAWQQALRKSRGPSSTKTARSVLSGVLGYAARLDAISANPVRDLSVVPAKAKRRARAMTRDERDQWLAALEESDRACRWALPDVTRFMLATGCRIGEVLAVTWDDVDLEAGTVRVAHHLVRVTGEGLRRVEGAKSDAGERTLPLPQWAQAMLMRRRTDPRSAWPVFPDSLGGWRDPSNLLRVLRQERDAAGYGWVTSHVFRKTVLTVLDDAGLSPRMVADVAGHSDPSMTQRVYMERGKVSAAAADALEDLL